LKFAPMAIPAMALLQQHVARWDILTEPAARRRAAIEARGHSELGTFGTGAQSGRKNQPASGGLSCLSVTLVYCGQTVGWIKMKLGIQVGLGPGHIVLDGDPAPPRKGHRTPLFSAHVYCGHGRPSQLLLSSCLIY